MRYNVRYPFRNQREARFHNDVNRGTTEMPLPEVRAKRSALVKTPTMLRARLRQSLHHSLREQVHPLPELTQHAPDREPYRTLLQPQDNDEPSPAYQTDSKCTSHL